VPGKEFGFEGHLRAELLRHHSRYHRGLDRIKWALDPNSANELYLGDRKLTRTAMNLYLDVQSPAVKEAGKLASAYGLANHGL